VDFAGKINGQSSLGQCVFSSEIPRKRCGANVSKTRFPGKPASASKCLLRYSLITPVSTKGGRTLHSHFTASGPPRHGCLNRLLAARPPNDGFRRIAPVLASVFTFQPFRLGRDTWRADLFPLVDNLDTHEHESFSPSVTVNPSGILRQLTLNGGFRAPICFLFV